MTENEVTEDVIDLIPEEQLRKIVASRTSELNRIAKHRGEDSRVSGSELIDLYYKQRGLCAITGWRLEHHCRGVKSALSIELDHIIEINGGSARLKLSRPSGWQEELTAVGSAADIDNLQWVCRFANQLKEKCRAADVCLEDLVRSVTAQANEGFPIRKKCENLGRRGARAYREELLWNLAKAKPGFSAAEAARILSGTQYEACEGVIRKQMQELGLLNASWRDRRIAVLHLLASENDLHFESTEAFVLLANRKVGHNKGFTLNCWRQTAKDAGLVVNFQRLFPGGTRTRLCAGDRAACLAALRIAADKGMLTEELRAKAKERGVPANLIDGAIQSLLECYAAYEHEGRLFASLTRQEAADLIGVSVNRLKKWARADWHDQFAGPEFMKDRGKSMTFYRRDVVREFAENRSPHKFDLSRSGKREHCVEGGKKGGRPPGATESQKVLCKFC